MGFYATILEQAVAALGNDIWKNWVGMDEDQSGELHEERDRMSNP